MEQVLGSANKVIVENGSSGSGVVPYLPLNELRNQNSGAQ
jgi:membrane protease subunit HflK